MVSACTLHGGAENDSKSMTRKRQRERSGGQSQGHPEKGKRFIGMPGERQDSGDENGEGEERGGQTARIRGCQALFCL